MDYAVRHVTRFRYSAPVTESVMQVYMQPRREGPQHCPSFELTTDPTARITATRDSLGNIVHHFDIPRAHSELTITARALVTILAPPSFPESLEASAWDELDAEVGGGDFVEMLIPSQFARPTPTLAAFARELELERRSSDPLSLVRAATARVHAALTYAPNTTLVDSPIDDALEARRGVCQDFSHVLIAILRGLDIPTRYVSGYLYSPPGATERTTAETHAWVEAYLPGLGWVGVDPTNDALVRDEHIRVAVGRDYADVPPTRGVFKGRAETELGVAVHVALGNELVADEELLLVTRRTAEPEHPGEQPMQQQQERGRTRR